ncbi:hypothetical protein TNIN_471291 [Trichonephila inaurata madagascariensis]|uniref:Uncharacterized protein n=1 Tax=Trichonephila inaurata madagascariensis TaxID=2747483 RepID=A0A8X6Y2Q0_9ARAC|nr:hypothetical protein TNIN_471291 [Trichonephila inaurata madagascariensis]
MLPFELRFYSWEQKKIWQGQVRGMTQRCYIVVDKILHYAKRRVARCIIMLQPPVVSDVWADKNNAFSQSCENSHLKTASPVCPGGMNYLSITQNGGAVVVFPLSSLPSRNKLCHSKTLDQPMAALP